MKQVDRGRTGTGLLIGLTGGYATRPPETNPHMEKKDESSIADGYIYVASKHTRLTRNQNLGKIPPALRLFQIRLSPNNRLLH